MWIQIKGFPFGLRWDCGSSSTVCMKVLVISDSTQLDKLGDVALLLCGWFQVWDWGGIKALEPMPKTYFSWDELRVVPFEMLEEQWRNTISLYQLGGSKWSCTVLVSHHGNEKLSSLHFPQFSSYFTFQQPVCSIPFSALPISPATVASPSSSPSPIITTSASCPITGIMPHHQTGHSGRMSWAWFSHPCIGVWSPLRHISYFKFLLACGRFDTSLVFFQSNRWKPERVLRGILNGIRYLSQWLELGTLHISSTMQLSTFIYIPGRNFWLTNYLSQY